MVKAAQDASSTASGNMLASLEVGRYEALHAWKQACLLYSRYFSALAKAENPVDMMRANADFMAGVAETFGRNAAGFLNLDSARQPLQH